MTILKARYENDPNALWSNQTNVIYDSQVPGSVIVPDGYLVFGVPAALIEAERRSYRIDEWGVPPAFVLEVAPESTAHRDLGAKRELYARMGAQEYWRLDRHGYYGEPLVGERLVDGEYVRFPLRAAANGDVWARSEVLGVDFYYRPADEGLGAFLLRDSESGEWLHDLSEERNARAAAEAQATAAEAQVVVAEAQALAAQAQTTAAEARAQEYNAQALAAEARAQESEAQAKSAQAQAAAAQAQTVAAEAQALAAETRAQESETRNQELQAELDSIRRQMGKQ